jgi:hypothetical protein
VALNCSVTKISKLDAYVKGGFFFFYSAADWGSFAPRMTALRGTHAQGTIPWKKAATAAPKSIPPRENEGVSRTNEA